MNVPVAISGGGIIGNYISLRLKRNNIDSLVIEKSDYMPDMSEGIRTLTLNNHSMSLLKAEGIDIDSAPINEINAFDGEGTGKIQFLAQDIDESYLSHVVMFNDLKNRLTEACKDRTIFNNEINSIQKLNYICPPFAGVVKLVDTLDLGSSALRLGGSSPFTRTKKNLNLC